MYIRDDVSLLDYRALALRPVLTGEYMSEIITTHGVYYSTLKPVELLNEACLRHHSTKEGREAAAKKILKFYKKPPFLISETVGVFPIMSSIHPECIWIFSNFFEMESVAKKKTRVIFNHETNIIVPVSLHTVTQQKSKLHLLLSHAQQSKRQYIPGQIFLPWIDGYVGDQPE